MKVIYLLILSLLGLPSLAYAWGGDGHQIICLIAEDHLTPKASAAIHDLLGRDVNISDAQIANWADQIRDDRKETGPWHYVDIPIDARGFDEKRDGDNGNNVIDKTEEFEKVLANKSAPKAQRAEALKFVVHFIGDAHQPLHCAERNNDKGGNTRLVFFLDQKKAVNLHQCWDTLIILQQKGTMKIADFADGLNSRITKSEITRWSAGAPLDWANESHLVAREKVYAGVPAEGRPPKIDQRYVDRSEQVIDEQLEKAGIRLAWTLNRLFGQ